MNFHAIFSDPQQQQTMLDSAASNAITVLGDADLDTVALNAEIQNMRKAALILVLSLSKAIVENELDENELPSDRLDSLIAGFSSADETDEDIEVDQATLDIMIANIQDALESLGVSEKTIRTMFDDGEDAEIAIESAAETIESQLPEGDELEEFFTVFIYGEPEDEMLLDGVSVGKKTTKKGKFGNVTYKAVKAIRNGKVTVVNKRISGRVKLTSKQKNALAKARRKSTTSSAIKQRVKSIKKHNNLNL